MEKLTLNDGHVRALKHLSKSWCYLDELRKDAELSDLWELMAAEYATHSTRDKRIFLTITNAGRAALAEYEAPPIMPAPDDVATLKARIIELEANVADALEVSRIKGEELAAAIAENEAYRGALKPFAESVNDGNVLLTGSDEFLHIESRLGYPAITHNGDFLCVSHLRDAAKVYAKFKGAGDDLS